LNEAMDYERFDLVEVVLGGGNAVATGKPFESEIVRIWTFRGGRAVKVRSYYDTQAYAAALAPWRPRGCQTCASGTAGL
jgi:ketosteroid isomerase-like protein